MGPAFASRRRKCALRWGSTWLVLWQCLWAVTAGDEATEEEAENQLVRERAPPPLLRPRSNGLQYQEWEAVPNSYCSKGGKTVPLVEDESMGFGVTGKKCRAMCAAEPECKVYTFGRWEKGMTSAFGGHYGEMRCQLYNKCEVKEIRGMTIFQKPQSGAPLLRQNSKWLLPAFLALGVVALAGMLTSTRSSSHVPASPAPSPQTPQKQEAYRAQVFENDEEGEDIAVTHVTEDGSQKISIDLTSMRSQSQSQSREETPSGKPLQAEDPATTAAEVVTQMPTAEKPKAISKRISRAGFTSQTEEHEYEEDLSKLAE